MRYLDLLLSMVEKVLHIFSYNAYHGGIGWQDG
jgi:hypothetical protein